MVIIPFRRCTDAHLKKTILEDGEIAINESTKTIHYGDNKTPGGIPIKALNADDATHAVNADSATNDSKGQNIAGTYIKGFSVSGQTVIYTRGDGTTGKFTTQDNNTTYSAGSNLSLSGTQFNVSSSPTFNSVKVTNNSSNDILFGNYRVYVG